MSRSGKSRPRKIQVGTAKNYVHALIALHSLYPHRQEILYAREIHGTLVGTFGKSGRTWLEMIAERQENPRSGNIYVVQLEFPEPEYRWDGVQQ